MKKQHQTQFFKHVIPERKKINVHAFFVDMRAKQNFKEIARASNGRCKKLEINSEKGSDQLTNLVSDEVLRNAREAKVNALVDYRAKFSKFYTLDMVLFFLWNSKFVQIVIQESIQLGPFQRQKNQFKIK
ncbi:hypothetical protein RFI_25263 [Reticulomyxa filosa]|uniref:Uncharacterized protein n=1 Tax=Reticulomyxa filosa TaxID=46433 RepID=X6MDL6_RETFI|nr:hypothetical protein RFI_25263 [Reticulomyxa filosa]|eukprot:ETO12113.1 hypothetical protein RFI_25263 [Reticulomyxa filosa]